jgi:hypothetical protein
MSPIFPLPAREAHPDLDAEAGQRADRLSRSTTQEMQTALAFLSMIDPEAFEIAFQAVPSSPDALPDVGEPEPLCRRCGGPVALFPDQGMSWHHYQSTADVGGEPSIVAKRHKPRVRWYLPDEVPDGV